MSENVLLCLIVIYFILVVKQSISLIKTQRLLRETEETFKASEKARQEYQEELCGLILAAKEAVDKLNESDESDRK